MWHHIGKKDGFEFAKRATYIELVYATRWETFPEYVRRCGGGAEHYDPRADAILGGYFRRIFDQYESFGLIEVSPDCFIPNTFYETWEYGWSEGVFAYWNDCWNRPCHCHREFPLAAHPL